MRNLNPKPLISAGVKRLLLRKVWRHELGSTAATCIEEHSIAKAEGNRTIGQGFT